MWTDGMDYWTQHPHEHLQSQSTTYCNYFQHDNLCRRGRSRSTDKGRDKDKRRDRDSEGRRGERRESKKEKKEKKEQASSGGRSSDDELPVEAPQAVCP